MLLWLLYCTLILPSHHSVRRVPLGIILIFMKKLGEYELFEITWIVCGGLSLEHRCVNSQPRLWDPRWRGNHCTRRGTKMREESAACDWLHKALLPAAVGAYEKNSRPQTQHLANFFPVHHCPASWLLTSCWTSHVCSPSPWPWGFHSAVSFGALSWHP